MAAAPSAIDERAGVPQPAAAAGHLPALTPLRAGTVCPTEAGQDAREAARSHGTVHSVLERITRLLKRREETGPRVDVGPMFRGEAPANLSDSGVIEASDKVNRLPSRDYIGEEPGDLATDPDAEAQCWAHERELYKQKNENPESAE